MKYSILIIISSFLISINCSFQSILFNRMNKDKIGENLIISPLSIYQALSLAANGANGETLSEMLDLLQSDSLEELNDRNIQIVSIFNKFSTIDIANAVMTKFTPLETFAEIAKQYLAPIEPLISVEQVNNWCSNKTHGKIEEIINELNPDTLMIILNAVYFKGEWILKFDEYLTKKLPFYNLGSEEIVIDTMDQIGHFNYYEDKNVQAIELYFKEDFMSAIIILPSKGTDINKYINTLSLPNNEYNQIIEGLQYAKVHIQIPKFELEFDQSLNQILMDLGMYNAFNLVKADFTSLRKEGNLYIDTVLHKTYLKIFEDGCEAAAITAIVINGGSAMPMEEKIYDMKVNRPFLFLLKNRKLPSEYNLVFMSKVEKLG